MRMAPWNDSDVEEGGLDDHHWSLTMGWRPEILRWSVIQSSDVQCAPSNTTQFIFKYPVCILQLGVCQCVSSTAQCVSVYLPTCSECVSSVSSNAQCVMTSSDPEYSTDQAGRAAGVMTSRVLQPEYNMSRAHTLVNSEKHWERNPKLTIEGKLAIDREKMREEDKDREPHFYFHVLFLCLNLFLLLSFLCFPSSMYFSHHCHHHYHDGHLPFPPPHDPH